MLEQRTQSCTSVPRPKRTYPYSHLPYWRRQARIYGYLRSGLGTNGSGTQIVCV